MDEHDADEADEAAGAVTAIASCPAPTPTSSPAKLGNWLVDAAPAHGLKTGSQISLKQGDDVLAHGYMKDTEPNVGELFGQEEGHPVPECARIPQHWPVVQLTSVCRGHQHTIISKDSVFAEDGTTFDMEKERSLGELSLLEDIIIWHDFVFPRAKQGSVVKRKTSKGRSRRN